MKANLKIVRMMLLSFTIALLFIGSFSTPANAAGPWFVKPGGSDSNNCLSPSTACATINGAIGKASPGDTIFIAVGTYTGSGSDVVLISKNISLSGGWDTSFSSQNGTSTIDGENTRRGMTVNGGVTIYLERFAVQDGSSTGGGGIFNNGDLTLSDSTITGNMASNEGGGLFIQSGATASLIRSTVSNNSANSGGGIFIAWGMLSLVNSTISGNSASGGGGINNLGGTVTINNSTITDNSVSTMGGGGIRNEGGTVTLSNSILAGNHGSWAPNCEHTIGSAGYNLVGNTAQCTFSSTTGDLIDVSPLLGSLQDNGGPTLTHALLSGSPAIDAADNASCLPVDQTGVIRPVDGDYDSVSTCDIGSFEYVPPTFPDVQEDHWAWSFIEAIYAAGLTAGYPDGTYRPDNPVTRAEMAVFLKKGIHDSTYTPPSPDGSHPFSDISGHWAEAWMEDLYDEGLTSGYPDGTYRPENRVSRAEMAVFLLKAMHGSAYTPPVPSGGSFSDVSGHWAEAWIEQLKEEGITSGYPDGTYRPENQVTRAEMAVFLVNAFSLPLP